VFLLDPGDDPGIPALLRITVAELRKRLGIGSAFNPLKFHTASPKISFLSYPDFEKEPHRDTKPRVCQPKTLSGLQVSCLSPIKIDLKRLFVSVIDHTTGAEHQLPFFKERFSPRITRSGRRWHASARNSANSASARKPSATGHRRRNGIQNASKHLKKSRDHPKIPLGDRRSMCFGSPVAKKLTKNPRHEERKAELRIIRGFADKLIREGRAKDFLVEHGFHTPDGKLTKRYGG
jgi:hypothetical protein